MSTDTEERVVVDVDLDAVLPCNVRRDDTCDRPAEWVFHCPACGAPAQPCTPDRLGLDAWIERVVSRPLMGIMCPCGQVMPNPIPWSPI